MAMITITLNKLNHKVLIGSYKLKILYIDKIEIEAFSLNLLSLKGKWHSRKNLHAMIILHSEITQSLSW